MRRGQGSSARRLERCQFTLGHFSPGAMLSRPYTILGEVKDWTGRESMPPLDCLHAAWTS
jgi:hypothetical protein